MLQVAIATADHEVRWRGGHDRGVIITAFTSGSGSIFLAT
jgi:hypothetical protein